MTPTHTHTYINYIHVNCKINSNKCKNFTVKNSLMVMQHHTTKMATGIIKRPIFPGVMPTHIILYVIIVHRKLLQ